MEYSTLPDEHLAKIAPDDKHAFAELVTRYEKPLLRYVLRISDLAHPDAEDVLQEVFMKTWKNIRDFDADMRFSSWIYRITRNEAITAYRKRKARPEGNTVDDEDLFLSLPSHIDIRKETDTVLDVTRVRKILGLMPEKYREVLILKYLEEKSQDEISDILRIPVPTVATNLFRARQKFTEITERQGITFLTTE